MDMGCDLFNPNAYEEPKIADLMYIVFFRCERPGL